MEAGGPGESRPVRRAGPDRERESGAPSSPAWRSAASIVRSSPRASLETVLMAASAARACSGWASMRSRPTAAWTLMSEMLWPMTSWRSRAIRRRSSLARRRSSACRAARASATRSLAHPHHLGRDDQHRQPAAEQQCAVERGQRLPPDERGQPQRADVADHDDRPGGPAVPAGGGEKNGDDQAQVGQSSAPAGPSVARKVTHSTATGWRRRASRASGSDEEKSPLRRVEVRPWGRGDASAAADKPSWSGEHDAGEQEIVAGDACA